MYSATLFAGSYVNAVSLKNFGATRCSSLERHRAADQIAHLIGQARVCRDRHCCRVVVRHDQLLQVGPLKQRAERSGSRLKATVGAPG